MKKFTTNMIIAIGAYILIYAMLMLYLHISSLTTRDYCEQLSPDSSLENSQKLAITKQLHTELLEFPKDQAKILLIRQLAGDSAVCKAVFKNGKLLRKQFELYEF